MLLQVETDKVTIDVRYTASEPGTLKEYLVAADDTVAVGQEVARIETGAPVLAPAQEGVHAPARQPCSGRRLARGTEDTLNYSPWNTLRVGAGSWRPCHVTPASLAHAGRQADG